MNGVMIESLNDMFWIAWDIMG